MLIVDLLAKRLGSDRDSVSPVRLSLRSLCSVGLLFLLFGGSSASAMDYMLEYGVDAGSASDEGVVACRTSCVADIKSLGVMLHVSVSASGGSIQVNGVRERRGIRDCCLFEEKELVFADNERIASIDVDGAMTKLPIFSHVRRRGRLEKLGVLYLRIVNFELPPNSGNRRGPVRRGRFWSDDRLLGL
ncbi:hypothetical protein [Afipia sp. GAS231]|uniref:hypothetical protein n=1 Tax=Afipia sp. GAS231 TaxID=1882747 RepID=UPI00352AF7FF